jgi:hypothetical protein
MPQSVFKIKIHDNENFPRLTTNHENFTAICK